LEEGNLVIGGDAILAPGRNLPPEKFSAQKILPAQNRLAIPGVVNVHLHSHNRIDKGRFDNLPLELWMALYNPLLARRNWTPRETYLRAVLNGLEMLKGGTTTVIDDVVHGSFSEEIIE
jgi:5-methylthioadenosine/S-adenosylhomocysteine deaminase